MSDDLPSAESLLARAKAARARQSSMVNKGTSWFTSNVSGPLMGKYNTYAPRAMQYVKAKYGYVSERFTEPFMYVDESGAQQWNRTRLGIAGGILATLGLAGGAAAYNMYRKRKRRRVKAMKKRSRRTRKKPKRRVKKRVKRRTGRAKRRKY